MRGFFRLLFALFLLLSSCLVSAETGDTSHYTIKWGDTLTKIAKQFDTTITELVELNGIANPDFILADARLKLPVRTIVQTESSTGAKAPTRTVAKDTATRAKKTGKTASLSLPHTGPKVQSVVVLKNGPEMRVVQKNATPASASTAQDKESLFVATGIRGEFMLTHSPPKFLTGKKDQLHSPPKESFATQLVRAQVQELLRDTIPAPYNGKLLEDVLVKKLQHPLLL